ncbi:MAG: gliding motility-associated C-terminal domain-containing protein [Bacteroidetes bacterium]|nr:gliding motility-associated C-terminal domain-containing protein [Bacteroidota bacterium]
MSAQTLCSDAQPICAGSQNIFPAATGTTIFAQPGIYLPCYSTPPASAPRPSWHTLQIASSGSLVIQLQGSALSDIDFVAYGPFTVNPAVGNCTAMTTSLNTIGCGWSSSATETFTITNAIAGQYYLFLVTNWNNVTQNVIITQPAGTGALDCSSVCNMTGITSTVSSCNPALNTYSVTGTVLVNNVPTVGTLSITNSSTGATQVLNAPFPSPLTYSFIGLSAGGGTHSITARFSAITTCSVFSTYAAPSTPTVSVSASSNPVCAAAGSTLTASGSGVVSYSWSTGATSNSVFVNPVFPSATYIVSGTNLAGCRSTTPFVVFVSASPNVSASASPSVVCGGGAVTLSGSGANAYTWQPGNHIGNSVVVNPSVTTVYTVTGTFTSGVLCSNTATVSVNVTNAPTLNVSSSSPSVCAGNSVILGVTGSATSYTWLPGGSTLTSILVSPTVTTTYTVIGANLAGCTATATIVQSIISTTTIAVSPPSPTVCLGSSITMTASGASSYTWSSGGTGSVVTVTPSATAVYTVDGSNGGCFGTATVQVVVNPVPNISFFYLVPSAPNVSICVNSTAILFQSGTLGIPTYSWYPANLAPPVIITSNPAVLTPSVTTNYTVVGTLAGCTGTTTALISVDPGPTMTVSSTPTLLCSGSTATLNANAPTATAFLWTPGGSTTNTQAVTPTVTTNYSVVGTNSAGCSSTYTINQAVSAPPTVNVSSSSPSVCMGGGNVTLSATGALNYTWQPTGTTGSTLNVTPTVSTTYTVTGANLTGCTAQRTININVISIPTVAATSATSAICIGSSAQLTATGATNYTWQPGGATGSQTIVSPTVTTTYTVIGSLSGCTNNAVVTLTVNNPPILVANATPTIICVGQSATLSASSGAASYTWLPGGSTTQSIVVVPASTQLYSVTAVSAVGCSSLQTVNLAVVPVPTTSITTPPTTLCVGQSVTLNATGASNYTWQPSGATGSQTIVSPTVTTSYTVTGSNGVCTTTDVVAITVNPIPSVSITASSASVCSGNGSSATLTASGTGVTYTWLPSGATGSATTVFPIVTTTYSLNGENNFGCISTATIAVAVNPIPTISISSTNTFLCLGTSATLTGLGGSTYTWQPMGSTGSSVTVSPANSATYTLTGENLGCISTQTIAINVEQILVTASASPSIVCSGNSTTLTANGLNTYTWLPIAQPTQTAEVYPTDPTNVYTVSGVSAGGCNNTATVLVYAVQLPTLTVGASPSVICEGSSAILTVGGANVFTWSPGGQTLSLITLSPSVTTTYSVTGTYTGQILTCPVTTVVTVVVNPLPAVLATSAPTAICAGDLVTLNAASGTAINFTWSPSGGTGATVTDTPTTTTEYTVYAEDANNCSNTATTSVLVNPLPSLTITTASPISICEGDMVTYTATSSSAINFTWQPVGVIGSTVTDTPTLTTTYTVYAEDANACINNATVNVVVNLLPNLTVTASSTNICAGETVTLDVAGASTYTWLPSNSTNTLITDAPTATSDYTVLGTSTAGCASTETIQVVVVPIPTVSISVDNTVICEGSSVTFTAIGASNYTWLPSGNTSSVITETPTLTTTYTIIADNSGACSVSETVEIVVNTVPTNVTATVTGTLSCTDPTATASFTGNSTSTDIDYVWFGPSSYSLAAQNASNITIAGTYTLAVTNTITGCVATTTIDTPLGVMPPTVTASSSSGSITCVINSVTIEAVSNPTADVTYSWNGTITTSSFTTDVAGTYTVVVTDTISTCSSTAEVVVGSHTFIPITASVSPATCATGGLTNNDGTIMLFNFGASDKFDLVQGSTYTGTATYANAILIPTSGIVTNNLANPSTTVAYSIRLFDDIGCTKDTVLILEPAVCITTTQALGIAKAGSASTVNADGTYNITYTVVVKNYDTLFPISQIALRENLAATFPAPTTFTLSNPVLSASSSLSLHPNFTGIAPNDTLTHPTSSLAAEQSETIIFTVKVKPNGIFTYTNSVFGRALTSTNLVATDTSQNGLNPDFDGNGNPKNDNVPTVISLIPQLELKITKKVEASDRLADASIDLSYTVTVENLSNDTLYKVSVKDSLYEKTIKSPATYKVRNLSADGNLTANTLFDGEIHTNLLNASAQNKMPPNAVNKITFMVNVNTDTVRVISNEVYAHALSVSNPSLVVMDTSMVTVTVKNFTLFIPQGFSPNDDGINDKFVIKGLPTNGDNEFTVFNRWGNKVYYNANYDNSWEGYPNVSGALGNGRLPQGTYYFILDMKGSGSKPITGFIVIQY